MATSGLKKFWLLLWKNYILQKRHHIQTIFELLVPALFTILLVSIRGIVKSDNITERTEFPAFDVGNPNLTFANTGCYILYSPDTPLGKELMEERFKSIYLPGKENFTITGYSSEESLLEAYKSAESLPECPPPESITFPRPGEDDFVLNFTTNKNRVIAAVIFSPEDLKEGTSWSDITNIAYDLRFPAGQHGKSRSIAFQARWRTELLYPIFQFVGPRDKPDNMTREDPEKMFEYASEWNGGMPGYWIEGFLYTQQAIDRALRSLMGVIADVDMKEEIKLARMPYPPYIDDVFLIALQNFLPLIIVFSFIYSVINITKSIAYEKEKRLKESMKMMGLPNWLHWTAWFLKSYLFILISIILMVILLKIKFYNDGNLAVLTKSDGTLVFFFLLCYAFSIVTFSFLISTLFSTANSAATAAGVIFFLSYFPYTFLQNQYETLSKNGKLGPSILSNTALSFGCQLISMWEGTGAGIQWSNLGDTASPDDNLTVFDIIVMMIFDAILYLLLALYIEGVFPGEYGLPMPWYFPFTKTYWCGASGIGPEIDASASNSQQQKPENFEKEPGGRAGIQIRGLTKIFDKKTAVNNLYLNMYDNQITALLGHNGAGKTTTMSMLTGLFPPSSGTAIVNGFDIWKDIKSVRENLGLCPQHDVLFPEMSVQEHLRFFAQLKGCEPSILDQEITRMLKAVNLENKREALAQELSGGMRRRLSVGIAFIGGSRVVLLDEPSSGLDPGARRQIWDLIQLEKKNRTIILSTHFMDEADLLGDRIAIMAEGQVKCCGSSLFLKKKYGGGYHLIIVKKSQCNVDLITEFLRHRIPTVVVDQNVGSELTYSLPDDLSHLFADMFEELEQRKDEFGIASYGASITTMEEVFMRVGKETEEEKLKEENGGVITVQVENGHSSKPSPKLYQHLNRNYGAALIRQQLWAMIVKKMLNASRNKVLLAVQTIIPIGFLIITMIMLKTIPDISNPPELEISLKAYKEYGDTTTLTSCSSANNDSFCYAYKMIAEIDSTVENIVDLEDHIGDKSEDNLAAVNYGYIAAMKHASSDSNPNKTYLGYFNSQPFHSPPLSLNLISNGLLNANRGNNQAMKRIHIRNFPLPLTVSDEVSNIGSGQSSGFQIGFTISFGMSFLAASFVVFLVKERETNAKHLQTVSGVRYSVFWLASFLFDAVNYIIPCFGLMIVLVAFQDEDFKSAEMQGFLFILLIFYGWSVIPFMYLFSFLFSVPSSAFTKMVLFNIFTGMATILTISILSVPDLDLEHVANGLEWLFFFLPNFSLGYGIIQLSSNHNYHILCPKLLDQYLFLNQKELCPVDPENLCCVKYEVSYLGWKTPGVGRNIFFMFLVGAICFAIIFIIEARLLQKMLFKSGKNSSNVAPGEPIQEDSLMDSDVAIECQRIRNGNLAHLFQTDNLILQDLCKQYGKFTAVDNLCLGVQKGECFGLLGINGAGKTTTFKMLTGDLDITSGNAFVYGRSVKAEIKKVQQQLGYCPQFDALIPELTGRETIRLFARLRGVKEEEIEEIIEALAVKLLFKQHLDKPCGAYSGGNKRKLSTALALVGNPPMVLLDEPTTGMDPVARRHLWDAISDVREAGTSIILTSHSMDECEALSTRLAIMVNGVFRCLGSTQHLKNKFGEGYTLIAQIEVGREERRMTRQSLELGRRRSSAKNTNSDLLQDWEKELQPIRGYIENIFPGSELKDIHAGYVHYHVKDTRITWGYMFRKMEEAKERYKIEAYSVGQTTLEQVFLNFTRAQINSDEE